MFSYKDILKQVVSQFVDSLTKFLCFLFILFVVISFFVSSFFVDLTKWVLFFTILFRMTSKNKMARKKENDFFLKLNPFSKNRKSSTHIYRKCKKCKTILKLPLPSHRGILHAACPQCQNRVTLFTLRKEKIKVEVIKK